MFNIKSLINQCLLAASLAVAATGAIAGPTSFHVAIDSGRLAQNTPGYITLSFSQTGNAGAVVASVSNLTGNTGTVVQTGAVSGGDSAFTIANTVNADGNFADISALFGGLFSFDISFSGNFMNEAGTDVSTLLINLFDTSYVALVGDEFSGIGSFNVAQGSGVASTIVRAPYISITPLATAEVPEPSQLMLMLAALAIMGVMVRRRAAH